MAVATQSANQTARALTAECIAGLLRDVKSAASDSSAAEMEDGINDAVRAFVTSCVDANATQLRALSVVVPTFIDQQPLNASAAQYSATTGFTVVPIYVNASSVVARVVDTLTSHPTRDDGWVLTPEWAASSVVVYQRAFLPDEMVRGNSGLNWSSINNYFRSAVTLGKSTFGVPLASQIPSLFYRRDVFSDRGLLAPATWDDVLVLAASQNGSRFGGAGGDHYSLCWQASPQCNDGTLLLAQILASMTQYTGSSSGWLFDPLRLTPLVRNAAMARALGIVRELSRYSWPDGPICNSSSSTTTRPRWMARQCLMTVDGIGLFKMSQASPELKGRVGTTQLPGSPVVFDRKSELLRACDGVLCSTAVAGEAAANSSTRYINRAPFFMTSSVNGVVNALGDGAYTLATFNFFSSTSVALSSPAVVMDLSNSLGPILDSQLDPTSESNVAAWVAAGYDAADVRQYLAATWAMLNSSNVALDLQVIGGERYLSQLGWAAWNSTSEDVAVAAVMDNLISGFGSVLNSSSAPFAEVLALYQAGLRYSSSTTNDGNLTNGGGGDSGGGGGLSPGIIVVIVVLPFLMLVKVVLTIIWFVHRMHKRSMFGRAKPPGASPKTTLLVTDLVGSTQAWEVLPGHVMDRSVNVHNSIIRRLLHQYNGYESAVEGDAFLAAFHTAQDALAFTLAAQRDLLHADWPPELLEHHTCRPVWAVQAAPDLCGADRERALEGLVRGRSGPWSVLWRRVSGLRSGSMKDERPRDSARTIDQAMPSTRQPSSCEMSQPLEHSTQLDASPSPSVQMGRDPSMVLLDMQPIAGGAPAMTLALAETPIARRGGDSSGCGGGGDGADLAKFPRTCLNSDGVEQLLSAQVSTSMLGNEESLGQSDDCRYLTQNNTQTAAEQFRQCWSLAPPDCSPERRVLVFRGLRVRMALHSGVPDKADVELNKTASRVQYSGTPMAVGKALVDAAQGGMILLSKAAFHQLAWATLADTVMVLNMGNHRLGAVKHLGPLTLYQALGVDASQRLGFFDPVRSEEQSALGVLEAPVGTATIAFMRVVGVQTLLSWDKDVTRRALESFQGVAHDELVTYGGYLAEMADGLCLAAFSRPSDAMAWAVSVVQKLKVVDWPEELLRHELCEPTVIEEDEGASNANNDASGASANRKKAASSGVLNAAAILQGSEASLERPNSFTMVVPRPQLTSPFSRRPPVKTVSSSQLSLLVLQRGLRIKVGIDIGQVKSNINSVTGRMAYKGRVMNRAARIAERAPSGQVWASGNVARGDATYVLEMLGIRGKCVGNLALRGVAGQVELWSCLPCASAKAGGGGGIAASSTIAVGGFGTHSSRQMSSVSDQLSLAQRNASDLQLPAAGQQRHVSGGVASPVTRACGAAEHSKPNAQLRHATSGRVSSGGSGGGLSRSATDVTLGFVAVTANGDSGGGGGARASPNFKPRPANANSSVRRPGLMGEEQSDWPTAAAVAAKVGDVGRVSPRPVPDLSGRPSAASSRLSGAGNVRRTTSAGQVASVWAAPDATI